MNASSPGRVTACVIGSVLLAACASSPASGPAGRVEPPGAATPAPAAEVFAPGVISDAREQWRITFSPEGALYFAASDAFFPISRRATIYMTMRRGDGWVPPGVAPFSGVHSDMDPVVSPDGRRIYFSSIRPADGVLRGDLDIYVIEVRGIGYSEPVRLGPEVNTEGDELYPSVALDGTLYFASGPRAPAPGQHFDIFRARPAGSGFARAERLGPAINRSPSPSDPGVQAAWDFNPEISPDGQTLFFTSLRPGGHGLGDIYVSRLRNGEWTDAVNLGPAVNTAADEYHPTRSPDGEWLYFVRRGPSPGDFHRIRLKGLLPD